MKFIKHTQTLNKGQENEKTVSYDVPQYLKFDELVKEKEYVKNAILFVVNQSICKKLNSFTYLQLKNDVPPEKIQKLTKQFKLYVPVKTKKTPLEKSKTQMENLCQEDKVLMLKHLESILGTDVEFAPDKEKIIENLKKDNK